MSSFIKLNLKNTPLFLRIEISNFTIHDVFVIYNSNHKTVVKKTL